MKAYGEVDVYIYVFLISALVGNEWSASPPDRFIPRERVTGTYCIGGKVGPRISLDDVEKILHPTGTRTPTPRPSSPYARVKKDVTKGNGYSQRRHVTMLSMVRVQPLPWKQRKRRLT
jgi:hypothetical protein